MSEQPPQVVCGTCGAAGSGQSCAVCGGAVVKICPACHFRNAAAKNYCDSCGTEIRIAPAAAAPQAPLAPGAGVALPQAGRAQSITDAPASVTLSPRPAPKGRPDPEPSIYPSAKPLLPSGIEYFVKSTLAILAMLAMLAGGGLVILNVLHQNSPSVVVPDYAKRYLDALAANDYATAYAMLTAAARTNCTQEEFRSLRDQTPWTWANLEVERVEPDAVIMQYDLSVQGRPTVKDTIIFVDDNGVWARPYNWPAVLRAEQAFAAGNADVALMRAQQAVQLDPRDPMARGYLCEAVYYRRLATDVEKECLTALELAKRYPSKLSAKSLYHLHAVLGDAYMRLLNRPQDAVRQFTEMTRFPDMSPQDRCDILMVRADAYLRLNASSEALADLRGAQESCTRPQDIQFIKSRLERLGQR